VRIYREHRLPAYCTQNKQDKKGGREKRKDKWKRGYKIRAETNTDTMTKWN
jgi:hypothetical protein